jgi:hypothetical protein
MRTVRPLFESKIVPASLGSAPQRIQRSGSLVSEPVICFVLMKFMAHLSWVNHSFNWYGRENFCSNPASQIKPFQPPGRRSFPKKLLRCVEDHHVNMHEGRGISPSMWAFIVAAIVFGLTQVISILVLFRYGMSDNQSLPPSTAAETTFTVGTLIAFAIAASHWVPQLGW